MTAAGAKIVRRFQARGVGDRVLVSRHAVFEAYEDVAGSTFATLLSADALEGLSVMEVAMRSARSGSVAATTLVSTHARTCSAVMRLAMRSARSTSVAASAEARPL